MYKKFRLFCGNFKKSRKRGGFTLIELMLYISISVVILLFLSSFLGMLLESRVKNQTITEVDQQGMQVMEIMTQTLRNATAINAPAAGVNSAVSFSVEVADVAKNPTVFDISGDVIRITEGANDPVPITSDKVTASGVSFENISRVGTTGMLRVQFTLTHVNGSGKNIYDYSKTFYNSISLRQE